MPPGRSAGQPTAATDRRTPKATRPMNPTDIIDRDSLREDIPEFRAGDTVKVEATDGSLSFSTATN